MTQIHRNWQRGTGGVRVARLRGNAVQAGSNLKVGPAPPYRQELNPSFDCGAGFQPCIWEVHVSQSRAWLIRQLSDAMSSWFLCGPLCPSCFKHTAQVSRSPPRIRAPSRTLGQASNAMLGASFATFASLRFHCASQPRSTIESSIAIPIAIPIATGGGSW